MSLRVWVEASPLNSFDNPEHRRFKQKMVDANVYDCSVQAYPMTTSALTMSVSGCTADEITQVYHNGAIVQTLQNNATYIFKLKPVVGRNVVNAICGGVNSNQIIFSADLLHTMVYAIPWVIEEYDNELRQAWANGFLAENVVSGLSGGTLSPTQQSLVDTWGEWLGVPRLTGWTVSQYIVALRSILGIYQRGATVQSMRDIAIALGDISGETTAVVPMRQIHATATEIMPRVFGCQDSFGDVTQLTVYPTKVKMGNRWYNVGYQSGVTIPATTNRMLDATGEAFAVLDPNMSTVVLSGDTYIEDAWLNSGNTGYNYGNFTGATKIDLSTGSSYLIRLKNLPAALGSGKTISTCTLYCWVLGGGGPVPIDNKKSIAIKRVLKPWVAGSYTGATPAVGCGCTFSSWNGNDKLWAIAGGHNEADADQNEGNGTGADCWATPESTVQLLTTGSTYPRIVPGYRALTIRSDLVQSWYNGSMSGNGVLMLIDQPSGWYDIAGLEYSGDTKRPYFEISYYDQSSAAEIHQDFAQELLMVVVSGEPRQVIGTYVDYFTTGSVLTDSTGEITGVEDGKYVILERTPMEIVWAGDVSGGTGSTIYPITNSCIIITDYRTGNTPYVFLGTRLDVDQIIAQDSQLAVYYRAVRRDLRVVARIVCDLDSGGTVTGIREIHRPNVPSCGAIDWSPAWRRRVYSVCLGRPTSGSPYSQEEQDWANRVFQTLAPFGAIGFLNFYLPAELDPFTLDADYFGFWFRSLSLSGLTSGNEVQSWTSEVSGGTGAGGTTGYVTATQTSGLGICPIYLTGVTPSNSPVLRFGGTGSVLSYLNLPSDITKDVSGYTLISVHRSNYYDGSGQTIFHTTTSGSTGLTRMRMGRGDSGLPRLQAAGRRLESDDEAGVTGGTFILTGWSVDAAVFDFVGNTLKIYRNGHLVAENSDFQTTGTLENSNSSGATLGARADAAGGLCGDLVEIFGYKQALSDAQVAGLSSYFHNYNLVNRNILYRRGYEQYDSRGPAEVSEEE